MNLFLALFWLLCAVVLFAYEQFMHEAAFRIRWGGDSISGAWLLLVLGMYNIVRWWASRSYRAEQRALEIARATREWEKRRHPAEHVTAPDPNFNFTDAPVPTPNRNITDQPPSNN